MKWNKVSKNTQKKNKRDHVFNKHLGKNYGEPKKPRINGCIFDHLETSFKLFACEVLVLLSSVIK